MATNTKRKTPWGWLNGSIMRRMTLMVLLICLLLIALVWVLVVQLMEPVYDRSLRNDLERSASSIVSIMDTLVEQGGSITTVYDVGDLYTETISEECKTLINDAVSNGQLRVNERSIDIANGNYACIALIDSLSDSILHPTVRGVFGSLGETTFLRENDSALVTQLRMETHENGSIYYKMSSGQMVVGITTADGQFTVIVAANVERVSQAVSVFKQLMLPISILLILVAVSAAWFFSRWFTRPLTQLSVATRELTRGNYEVQVPQKGHDEIATLAGDFNTMAQEVQRSAELQRDLIANISHDLRTPLTLIKGYAETVRDLTGDNPAKRTAQLDVIVDEANRLSQLVGRVMELSRVSSGNEKPEPVKFNLVELCDEIAYRYQEYCVIHNLQFNFSSSEKACMVYADPVLLERAIENLLGNALGHVGDDNYLSLTITKPAKKKVRVEVSDHGEGISPDDLPYIFERYYRSRKDSGKTGNGLGLSITKAIFVAQGIQYGVQSQLGQGATFWFEMRTL